MRAQTDLKNHLEVVEQMDVERPKEKENCLELEEQMDVKRLKEKEKEQEFHLKQRYWN